MAVSSSTLLAVTATIRRPPGDHPTVASDAELSSVLGVHFHAHPPLGSAVAGGSVETLYRFLPFLLLFGSFAPVIYFFSSSRRSFSAGMKQAVVAFSSVLLCRKTKLLHPQIKL